MISFIEFMERVIDLNEEVITRFKTIIRQHNLHITTVEFLLLMKIQNSKSNNITPKEIAKKGSKLFAHLNFLLQSLEKKHLINLKNEEENLSQTIISIEKKGEEITKVFQNSKIPLEILSNLEKLEIYMQNKN